MLTPPDLAHDRIITCLREHFGLRAAQATFLPLGADVNSAVYRVTAEDATPYFLKLRRGNFNQMAVAVPAWLHAQGIRRVLAPLATATGQLWTRAEGFVWILYPFFEGRNGWTIPLSQAQWRALGASMRAVHTTTLPAELAARVPRESYSPRWREIVRAFDREIGQRGYDDPVAAGLAAFWLDKRAAIHRLVARAEQLGQALEQRAVELVVCHADLHAGNVLAGANDALAIVDWDEVILAPKERDLMFVGGGLFGSWTSVQEEPWFYAGYGPTAIDPVALAYYRHERIVADIAAYGMQIFGQEGSAEDRADGLRILMAQFGPNEVVEIAYRSDVAG